MSKRVNIASKRVNITRVNVASGVAGGARQHHVRAGHLRVCEAGVAGGDGGVPDPAWQQQPARRHGLPRSHAHTQHGAGVGNHHRHADAPTGRHRYTLLIHSSILVLSVGLGHIKTRRISYVIQTARGRMHESHIRYECQKPYVRHSCDQS